MFFRPVSSQEVYYIESGTEDGQSTATLTESTTESTHIGKQILWLVMCYCYSWLQDL